MDQFSPAYEIDPEYAQTLNDVVKQGVEVYAYRSKISPTEIVLQAPVRVNF